MTKIYFKTIILLIISNALLTAAFGFLSQWGEQIIISGIINSSILIALIFISYFFLQVKGIKTSKLWSAVFTFIPSLIVIILLTKNLIQINSGQYRELAFGIDMGGFFKPSHVRMILTALIIVANYLRFKKNKQ
jgi:hypothetical protein